MSVFKEFPEGFEPKRATKGSAGYDFFAPENIHLEPGRWTVIDTGVKVDAQVRGVFMMLVPRSSLGFRYGFRFRNTIGIIDSDYHENIKAVATVDNDLYLRRGARMFQGIFCDYFIDDDEIEPMQIRTGGYGSTGE